MKAFGGRGIYVALRLRACDRRCGVWDPSTPRGEDRGEDEVDWDEVSERGCILKRKSGHGVVLKEAWLISREKLPMFEHETLGSPKNNCIAV